ncbi:HAD family hydrolase [Methanocella sp. MCL-LM]|uniref:HAD family hydrolase n=1 Tax=Methanocella sp. MCL-LM TaxID=3412035 RepID=UPI003C729BA2
MTIDTVTFDVWNTLVVHEFYDDRLKMHRMKSIRDALRDHGHPCTCEEIRIAYDYTEECLTTVWKSERDISNDGHLALFLEGMGLEPDDSTMEIIRDPYSCALLDFRPKLVDGAADIINTLKEQGYRLGLISNTGRTPGRTMREVLSEYGLAGCFTAMTFSDEVGHIKPGRQIYDRALKSLGSAPENIVHVGDNPLLDVYGAKACGWKAILFTKYMANFEKYASKYYSANGRSAEPDYKVESLGQIVDALAALDISRPEN